MKAGIVVIAAFLVGLIVGCWQEVGEPDPMPEQWMPMSVVPDSRATSSSPSMGFLSWETPDSILAFRQSWQTHGDDRTLKRLLISEWVAFDAASAMAYALTLAGEDRRLFLTEIFLTQPQMGLGHLRVICGSDHPHALRVTVEAWLERASGGDSVEMWRLAEVHQLEALYPEVRAFADPHRALAAAALIADPEAREERVGLICQAWCGRDPVSAWCYARDSLSLSPWRGVSFRLFDDWMRKDAQTAFAYRHDLPADDPDPTYYYERLGSHWGEDDAFDETLAAVRETDEDRWMRKSFVEGLVAGGTITRSDQGLALLSHLSTGERQSLLWKIRDLLVEERGVAVAVDWITQIDDPYERLALQRDFPLAPIDVEAYVELIVAESNHDTQLDTLRVLADQPDFGKGHLAKVIGAIPQWRHREAWSQALRAMPHKEAFAFGEDQGGELWDEMRDGVLVRWAESDPQAVLEVLSAHERRSRTAMRIWLHRHPTEARSWIASQNDPAWGAVLASAEIDVVASEIDQEISSGTVHSWTDLVQRARGNQEIISTTVLQWAHAAPEEVDAFLSDPDNRANVSPDILEAIEERHAFLKAARRLEGP